MSMTLRYLVESLKDLIASGADLDTPVFAGHLASGEFDAISSLSRSVKVADGTGDYEPYDLEPGTKYAVLHVGH